MNEFVDYVMSFYGHGEIYDMGVTREHVWHALCLRLRDRAIPYTGDSLDREKVRDILIENFGYKWPEVAA
jgi:hypothetical protein